MSYFKTCPKCNANFDPGEKHICDDFNKIRSNDKDKVPKETARELSTDEIRRQLRELSTMLRTAQ